MFMTCPVGQHVIGTMPLCPRGPLSRYLSVDGKVRSLRPTFVAVFILELLETATIGTPASSPHDL